MQYKKTITISDIVKEKTMTQDFCMGCTILLSPHTRICSVCGLYNNYDNFPDTALDVNQLNEAHDDIVPENVSKYRPVEIRPNFTAQS